MNMKDIPRLRNMDRGQERQQYGGGGGRFNGGGMRSDAYGPREGGGGGNRMERMDRMDRGNGMNGVRNGPREEGMDLDRVVVEEMITMDRVRYRIDSDGAILVE